MIYYRVREEFDQRRLPKFDFLIANELYTTRERRELPISDEAFEKVNVPKTRTYWLFGARFEGGI